MLKSKVFLTAPENLQRELNDWFIQINRSSIDVRDIRVTNLGYNRAKERVMAVVIYNEEVPSSKFM